MTAKLPSLKCLDCGKTIPRGGKDSSRCWDCYRAYRRLNAVTLTHVCCDCGTSLTLSGKAATRCRPCYDADVRNKRAARILPTNLAPFGLIRIPEGVSVYYVRKGAVVAAP